MMKVNISPSSTFLHFPTSKSTLPTPPRVTCSAIFDGHDFTPKTHPKLKFSANSLRNSDLLEPSSLGIRPDPPEWPARDDLIRDSIARRANRIDLPLSLRMIKMKQRMETYAADLGEIVSNSSTQDPVTNICCSTLYIIREVQIQALKMSGLVVNEELSGVLSKVQREMTSSFIWLFKDVYAKTPALMLDVMLLTSGFAAGSLQKFEVETGEVNFEMGLWDSIVEEANLMGKGGFGLGSGLEEKLISPVNVEVESDEYEEFEKTNVHYLNCLFNEPNNPLFLFNYAQFLRLVSRDYDRAEQCFKRAIELDPSDAEIVSQYANFLWLVRKDIWGAEERFQQATTSEPDNSYHASKYASFLWSTGGDDTCYPLEPPPRGKC